MCNLNNRQIFEILKSSESVSNACPVISMNVIFYYIHRKFQNSNIKCEYNYEYEIRKKMSVLQ